MSKPIFACAECIQGKDESYLTIKDILSISDDQVFKSWPVPSQEVLQRLQEASMRPRELLHYQKQVEQGFAIISEKIGAALEEKKKSYLEAAKQLDDF
jgi:hypothetical protein